MNLRAMALRDTSALVAAREGRAAGMVKRLKLYLLRDAESVVDLDYEIAGGAFELRMSGSALLWWTGPDREAFGAKHFRKLARLT